MTSENPPMSEPPEIFGPNIIGELGYNTDSRITTNGVFYTGPSKTGGHAGSFTNTTNIAFSAQNSNSLFGKSSTIQPPCFQVLMIIKT